MPLPPPLDFFAMQTQMDQQRRQREQDALQNMLMQQEQQDRVTKKQDRIEQLGIDAIRAGGKLKDVEARYRGEATEQTAAGWRIYADAAKRNAAETEGSAQGATAQSTLAQLITNSGGQIQRERLGTGNQQIAGLDPAMLDQLKLQLMAGGEASPASEIERMAMLAQSNRAEESNLAGRETGYSTTRASRETEARQGVAFRGTGGVQTQSLSGIMAAESEGILPKGTYDKAYASLVANVGAARAAKIQSDARTTQWSEIATLRERRQSVGAGQDADLRMSDDMKSILTDEFGAEEVAGVNPANFRLLAQDRVAVDPYARFHGELRFAPTTGTADARKFEETRSAQLELRSSFDTMQSSFTALREAVSEGTSSTTGIGPGRPNAISDVRTWLGSGSPEAEGYKASMFQFVTALLKARQGSRPSDFDLKMYLALAPTLQEALAGTADAKLGVLRETLDASVSAASRSPMANQVMERKAISLDPTGRKAVGQVNSLLLKMNTDPDSVTDEDIINAFGNDLTMWQNSPNGKRFLLPNAPMLSDAAAEAVRRAMQGGGKK